MKIENQADLKKYTTFRMGGIAEKMYIPESEDELVELISKKHPKYFIGGGSNLIINQRSFDCVVNLREFNNTIERVADGEYVVGASVRLQKLINAVNADGYGGIEYLYSVPGLVGGATVMNAGRGKVYNQCISDYIIEVKVLHKDEVMWMKKADCAFSYRSSVFSSGDYTVLAVRLKFPAVCVEESQKRRQERLDLCKQKQDNSSPNFGTVFCESNKIIMQIFKYLPIGRKKGVGYSKKTANWLLNKDGTFEDTIKLLERVKKLHKITGKKCRTEVVIWE